MNARVVPLGLLLALGCSHVTKANTAPQPKDDREAAPPAAKEHVRAVAEPKAAAPGRPPLGTSPQAMMQSQGPRLLQEALIHRGYLTGPATDAFDERTQKALRRFQSEQAVPSTGAPDRETIRKLGLDPGKIFRPASD